MSPQLVAPATRWLAPLIRQVKVVVMKVAGVSGEAAAVRTAEVGG